MAWRSSGTSVPVTGLHRVPPEVSKCIYDWINSMALRNLHSLSLYRKQKIQAMKVLNRHPACNSKGVNRCKVSEW